MRLPASLLSLGLAALAATGSPAAAQVIRGQLLAAEDHTGIKGAFVILVDTLGKERAASLTDARGGFRIQAPEPGTYRLRWELVGRPIDQSERFTLAPKTETSLRILSFTQSQLLGPVKVTNASSCPTNPDAQRVASLWSEVTKALRVTQWTVNDERLVFDVETVQRTWDPEFRKVEKQVRYVHEGRRGRPFSTMSPEFLAEYGYFVAAGQEQHYFAPDERSLLHESFVSQHCLALAEPSSAPENTTGIRFTAAPDRLRPDIGGVFWLDRDSLLLRAIDYRFSGLQQFAMHEALGGHMEFDRLPTGEWYIARWSIRMPVMTLCRGTGLLGFLLPRNRPCLESIVEAAGEVLDVRGQ
jgi:hypothetical protein